MKTKTIFETVGSLKERDAEDIRALVAELDQGAVFDAAATEEAIESGCLQLIVHRRRRRIDAAAAIVQFRTPTGIHHRIEDVVVHPKSQGKGIGRKIMLFALDLLRENGAASVELTSRPARVAANALYRSLGFTQRETNVYEFRFSSAC